MIDTKQVWDFISQHSVSNYRAKMEHSCYDYSGEKDLSFITDNRTETDKGIFINLCLNNKNMVDLNVKFVMEYNAPFEEIYHDNNSNNSNNSIHMGSMMYSKFKVDFKYWKSNGNIDIVVTRNGVTRRYSNKTNEPKWKYYRLERKLKITKDNVYYFKGKSIQNANVYSINNMVFARLGCDDFNILYHLLYGGTPHYGFSVKKTREKQIYSNRVAFAQVHKIFESDLVPDKVIDTTYVNEIKSMFKCFKHRDLIKVIKTYLELIEDRSLDRIFYSNYAHQSYDILTGVVKRGDIQPPVIRTFADMNSFMSITQAFVPQGYHLTYNGKYKLGLNTVITKENCKDYGLQYYELMNEHPF